MGFYAIDYQIKFIIEKLRRSGVLSPNGRIYLLTLLQTSNIESGNLKNYQHVHVHQLQFGSARRGPIRAR